MKLTPNFLLLDAACIDEEMETAFQLNKANATLFNGKGEEYLRPVSPFLFTYSKQTPFAQWVQKEGWGHAWGVFVSANVPIFQMNQHFRKCINVRNEKGEIMYFRFYDPRVLRIFLPTCDKQQLKEFFGPVRKYMVEAENPTYVLIFHLGPEGDLQTEQAEADAFFGSPDFEPASASNPPALTLPSGVTVADTGASKRKWRFLADDDSPNS